MARDDDLRDLYRECLRNHAASLGSYATDGCGEFTLDDTTPDTLKCAACGCHRNFHRKVSVSIGSGAGKRGGNGGSFFGRDPDAVDLIEYGAGQSNESERGGKKRIRTKFSVEQKEKMLEFAEKLGWRIKRKDGEEDEIEIFCRSIGVSRQVFKVWMHNHKNSTSSPSPHFTANVSSSLTQ
ncbi:hypothetical protein AQUCO_00201198v1 [Aquilegia coerulea]|uniref:ZF-HD dimerization-type domain-containing protein n=1 Tax=Aquilegia coerulea TaxID=218851 RepID=A0A2G5F6Q3_AQUCA|nr:hypothetical protein AQUCO_00201198v1 [Aquilegia coerulea]